MTIFDYEYMPVKDKKQWLESFKITSGLKYFGGKSTIGKYLVNHILNMAVRMKNDGKKADIFVDAFAGGGKIALSMPTGWFDKIVLNDMNYGVYNFFKCCKESPRELVKMIEEFGSIMSEDMFRFFAFCRSNDGIGINNNIKKKEGRLLTGVKVEPLVSAAMTYWVTQVSFNGATDPYKASYRLGMADNKSDMPTRSKEKEDIQKIVKHAQKHIRLVHEKMLQLNIVVENLDYKQLIRKYNGKIYVDSDKTEKIVKELGKYNKLWYFDPPYHPETLSKGQEAPYEDSFEISMVKEMTEILHGDYEKNYGAIEYFIKSDYCPKDTCKKFNEKLEDAKQKLGNTTNAEKKQKYHNDIITITNRINNLLSHHLGDFDMLEDNIKSYDKDGNVEYETDKDKIVFYRLLLGEFDKGASDDNGFKLKGREYIWCRGNYIPESEQMFVDEHENN